LLAGLLRSWLSLSRPVFLNGPWGQAEVALVAALGKRLNLPERSLSKQWHKKTPGTAEAIPGDGKGLF
jgi:hypothetical protein